MRTKKPTLRITGWLRPIKSLGPGISFEAECSAYANAKFNIPHEKRKEFGGYFHQPDREVYMKLLQLGFDEHLKLVHPEARNTMHKTES